MKTGLESLEVGAPEITYSGNQGPKSPQEDQRMMQEYLISQIEEEYLKHVFEMEEQGLQPMSMQEFMQQVLAEGQMSSNEEPTIGDMPMDMEQDPRTMAASGGIMGVDGRTGFRGGDKMLVQDQVLVAVVQEVVDKMLAQDMVLEVEVVVGHQQEEIRVEAMVEQQQPQQLKQPQIEQPQIKQPQPQQTQKQKQKN